MKLYSAWYCPFAQRAWLALQVEKIPFEYVEIDPYLKTQSWMEISRNTGQVPVITVPGQHSVIDSTRIIEFIEQLHPSAPKLFSADAFINAEQKYWIEHINKRIIPYFYRYFKFSDSRVDTAADKKQMIDGLHQFAQAIDHRGPFFNGEQISAVDIALIPFAYRINLLLQHYRRFKLPENSAIWQKYLHWYQANIETSAFRSTVSQGNYQQRLIDFYLPYSQGGGQQDVTQL
ncbi:MAG: glutathione S-transferase N-terminal domain-containing protein [Pseudomonadales bacterium]|nr:glutathione S-transferase N-terminal domain-containing protein [Pseudomonadales bacterium]NRA17988.1 glutathione S-transferase N-terminal domain-containing protein [Oceanospirillaceae bacterium]